MITVKKSMSPQPNNFFVMLTQVAFFNEKYKETRTRLNNKNPQLIRLDRKISEIDWFSIRRKINKTINIGNAIQ